MISAADFDDVFAWTAARTCATLSQDRVVDVNVLAEVRNVLAFVGGLDVCAEALPGAASHLDRLPQVAVGTRPRHLVAVTA